MGPGFKYHIVSISAIFFALTIGLVVGSVFVSPQYANRQEHAIHNLQDTLNSDVEEKRKEILQYRECIDTISPLALRGRLDGEVVAIIQTGDYADDASRANDAVALANPRGVVHLSLTSSLDRSAEDVRAALHELHATDPAIPQDREGLLQSISTVLARGDASVNPLLPGIERAGFARLTPEDTYNLPVKLAVIVAGSRSLESDRTARIDIPLIRALLKQGISVVACEGTDAANSDIPAFRSLRDEISTVDNIDTEPGRCALVLAFGAERGNFGVKPGAVRLLPLPEPRPAGTE